MTKKIVAVQGLGFVGAVMSLVVANNDDDLYDVIGIDLPKNQEVVDKLNQGVFPIVSSDEKIDTYLANARRRGNFRATTDSSIYKHADVIIVDINLDVEKGVSDDLSANNYNVSLDGFKKAMETIAGLCKEDVLLLVETTVPPGTCSKIIKPIFKKIFDKRGLMHSFKIAHSYERVMPGPGYVDSIKNFYRVYSGIDVRSADAAEAFLKTIISTEKYPLTRLENTNSTEIAKVLENSFRAMNIAFIQEWTEFAEVSGVCLHEVVDAIRLRPTHRNMMKPGLGVGGYCLTKDPLLASWSSQYLFNSTKLTQSEKAVSINDNMPFHTMKIINELFDGNLNKKRILILGVSYLSNVGDTRFSPVKIIYDNLISSNSIVTLHDPFVPYWEEAIIYTQDDVQILNNGYDIILIGCPHSYYVESELLKKLLDANESLHIVDPYAVLDAKLIDNKMNHKLKVIGRGNG